MRNAGAESGLRRGWAILQVERRLVQLGCPQNCVRQNVRELTDHFEDLKQAAMEDGMSEAAAEAQATEALGNPSRLAEHLAFVFRQSSWWGRHPIIGLCLVPNLFPAPFALLSLLALWGAFLVSNFLPGARASVAQLGAATVVEPDSFKTMFSAASTCMECGAAALVGLLFCWLARRSGLGLKWAFAASCVAAVHGLFDDFTVQPHLVVFGWYMAPKWLPASMPMLIFAAVWLSQWRAQRHLAFCAGEAGQTGALLAARPPQPAPLPKMKWITPSSVIACVIALGIAGLSVWGWREYHRGQAEQTAREELLRSKIWPEERAAAVQRIRTRQLLSETTNATTIDLGPFLNARLAESIQPINKVDDNLAELPLGLHVYGGAPFDVKGRVQLAGRDWLDQENKFPLGVHGIIISRKCARLHLFHGASCVPQDQDDVNGTKIARLILHYADGSREVLCIRIGEQVLDWHGPAYTTDATTEQIHTSDKCTELAWLGSNADLQRTRPAFSLRLYKSTFANPKPGLEVVSVDYVSTVTKAAPFLAGLTVE